MKRSSLVVGTLAGLLLLAACVSPTPQTIVETVQVTVPVEETVVVTQAVTPEVLLSFSTPHPILGDVRVRQAIAYCTDREALIRSLYPYVPDPSVLRIDTFLPPKHWAAAGDDPNVIKYDFDAKKGQALLEDAGWTLADGATYRANAKGEPLALKLTTTNAQLRQTWSAVFEDNMKQCGVRVLRLLVPTEWWQLDPASGLARRDFELGAYAWTSAIEPDGESLYSCDQIPRAENNWTGQNYMGWCNEAASAAIQAANHSLLRQVRVDNYRIAQEAFTQDMVSLPLFYRAQIAAARTDLANFSPNTTDDYLWNADQWELPDSDTVIVGTIDNPATLFARIEPTTAGQLAAHLIYDRPYTSLDYDYQPHLLVELPTLENGKALNNDVQVQVGDEIVDAAGQPVSLASGTVILNSDGEPSEYSSGIVTMKQLVVQYQWVSGLTFPDGQPLKAEDFELAYHIDCDPVWGPAKAGAPGSACDKIQSVDFDSDTSYTVTWKPGMQDPRYFLPPFGYYPAHRTLSDGRLLSDVPAADWVELPEITQSPMGVGPYQVAQWDPGQQLVLQANPFYWKGTDSLKLKTIIFQFSPHPADAVQQLLAGRVDVLGPETIGVGGETLQIMAAAQAGTIQAQVIPSPFWEHIDMNLFVP